MNFDNLEKKVDVVETKQVFDLSKTTNEIVSTTSNEELVAITDTIVLSDVNTIVSYGKEAAEGISKCSDSVLRMVEMDKLSQTGQMMNALSSIMEEFDPKELSNVEEKKGFFSNLFNSAKSQLERILAKYETMGGQVDKIYLELKKFEKEIGDSNAKLEQLFQANIDYYKQLEKYILACPIAYEQIDDYRKHLENEYNQTGDTSLQFKLQTLDMGKQMLEQREQDLRIAENVALQSIPMLKQMQFSNFNLIRKINSAFIITLPVFKQSLAQAVLLKRQRIQAESLATLDAKTQEMLIKNAQNAAEQAKLTTQLATGSSIKMETLETTWNTIMQGAEECRIIADENAKKREEEKVKLVEFKEKMKQTSNLK